MDLRADISEFLRSRRARITPEQAGLNGGGTRRVPGLRREEVAVLAAISVDWYVRIERGQLAGVSDDVLDALAGALQLDDAETTHLFDLARAAQGAGGRRGPRVPGTEVSAGLQTVLDAVVGLPAWVRNHRYELIATNALARALNSEMIGSPIARGNFARFVFLDPAARDAYREWEKTADDTVAVMRGYAGANTADRRLTALIGELATRSDEFARRWAAHDVRYHRSGVKRMRHPAVGDLDLVYEALAVPGEPTFSFFVYHPADEPSRERLALLASWGASEDAEAGGGETLAAR